jgi:hypothetical protein
MVPTADRRTWRSTAAPVAPRLELRDDAATRTILDGAWWPRSRDAIVELTDLVIALDARELPVKRFMLNAEGWDGHPRRISVAGRTVRLGWFATLETCLLIGTTGDHQRVDLLVVPADTPAAVAGAAMAMASSHDNTQRATDILAAASAGGPRQPRQRFEAAQDGGQPAAGRVNGHRSPARS